MRWTQGQIFLAYIEENLLHEIRYNNYKNPRGA